MLRTPVVVCLSGSIRALKHLFTQIRDAETGKADFVKYSNRLMTLLCEEGLTYIDSRSVVVTTPTGSLYNGEKVNTASIVAVSIIRAGDSLLDNFLKIVPEAEVGKILIQRNEETALPTLFYAKLPTSLHQKAVVLLDPMLATGGSAKAAIRVLLERGALERDILFLNVVSCPEGISSIHESYPEVRIVTGEIDTGLNQQAYIVPGLGDYGDRYYGTTTT